MEVDSKKLMADFERQNVSVQKPHFQKFLHPTKLDTLQMRGWSLVALVDHCSVYGDAGEPGEPLYGYTGTPFTHMCLPSAGRGSHAP